MTPQTRSAAVLATLGLALAGCGSSTSHSSASHSSAAASSSTTAASSSASSGASAGPAPHALAIKISGYAYHPATTTVAAGARVTFTNADQTAHTATSTKGGVFDTGTLAPGKSHTVVLSKPGTYTYYCQFHAFMKGEIIVR